MCLLAGCKQAPALSAGIDSSRQEVARVPATLQSCGSIKAMCWSARLTSDSWRRDAAVCSPCHSSADWNLSHCCYIVICCQAVAMLSSKTPIIDKNCSDFSKKSSVGLGIAPEDGEWPLAICNRICLLWTCAANGTCAGEEYMLAQGPRLCLFSQLLSPSVFMPSFPPHLRVENPRKHTSHSQDKGHWVSWGKQKKPDGLTDLQT